MGNISTDNQEYLMISNPGVAPLEGFLLMGASDKDSQDANTIGMFGSGVKYSVAQLFRVGRPPVVYLGTDKLEWGLGDVAVRGAAHKEILYRVNGGGWKSYGSVIQMGQRDWNDLWMPIREFVSNALDEVGGNPAGIRAELVDKAPRAKAGETRVYIPWGVKGAEDATTLEYLLRGLRQMFLHFRPDGNILRQTYGPIEKSAPGPPQFFRRGVLVRAWQGAEDARQSLWDYNFRDLELDEARKASDWDLAYKVGQMLASQPKIYVDMALRLAREDSMDWWEGRHLNQYSLKTYNPEAKQGIQDELRDRLGETGVLAGSVASAQIAQSRGLKPLVLPPNWVHAIEDMAGPTVGNMLGDLARLGKEEAPATPEMHRLVEEWAGKIESWGLAGGVGRPAVVGFREHPGQGGMCKGQYQAGKKQIQLNLELGGEDLEMTILEELAHHYSGQADYTRGFQEWLLRVVLKGVRGGGEVMG